MWAVVYCPLKYGMKLCSYMLGFRKFTSSTYSFFTKMLEDAFHHPNKRVNPKAEKKTWDPRNKGFESGNRQRESPGRQ